MPVNTQNQFSTTIPSSPLTNRLGVANAGVGVSTHEPNNQSFEMFSFTFSPEVSPSPNEQLHNTLLLLCYSCI